MRAILPGRPQSTRQALCTAEWDGLRLVAYISGDTAIVFDGKKNILQTIFVDDVESLHAITIEESSGRIAVCDRQDVYLYQALGRDEGSLRWVQMHKLQAKEMSKITALSWGSAEELLVAGSHMMIWNISESDVPEPIWIQELANPVDIALFSPDAGFIASCGLHDRIVKIWRRLSYEMDGTRFDVSYLRHPSTVTNLHWRKPWHSEQNLNNLLYTFCSDNQIRVWAHSDPHTSSVVQSVATIDMTHSIQPRRLSVSSMSKRRYAFIFDSRDFSSATEKAILASTTGTNHALEHLIEVANRSPEICVILDGVGHMSVWGLENAGYKSKQITEKFNVTLVDDLDIRLPSENGDDEEYVRFTSFAGGSQESSVSLLAQSYSGQIDWYEGSIADFFDTSAKEQRTKLTSSWSGHDSTIEYMISDSNGQKIVSCADEGIAILWSQSSSGALVRQSEIKAGNDILDVLLLDDQHVIALHETSLSLWDVHNSKAIRIADTPLSSKVDSRAQFLCKLRLVKHELHKVSIIVIFEGSQTELFTACLASSSPTPKSNGFHELLSSVAVTDIAGPQGSQKLVASYEVRQDTSPSGTWHASVLGVSPEGVICAYNANLNHEGTLVWNTVAHMVTNIKKPSLVQPLATGKVAIVNSDGLQLSIWDVRQGCCEYVTRLEGVDRIKDLKWTATTYGNLILAVSFAHHIKVLGQHRLSGHNQTWKIFQDIRLRNYTTHPIGDLCWLREIDLAVAAGNQIFVFETVTESESANSQDAGKRPALANVGMMTDLANSELPIFHPDLLRALMSSAERFLAERIIVRLYHWLTYYTEGDDLPSDMAKLNEKMGQNDWSELHVATSAETSTFQGESDVDFEEVIHRLQDDIAKVGAHQLCSRDKIKLSHLIRAFLELKGHVKSMDENGLRYLLAFIITPENEPLPWSACVAASLSSSQEAILDIIMRHYDSKITFPIARRLGLFLWLSELETLRLQLENVGRAEYNKDPDNRNPTDCSIYYLALGKKQVLIGLWRTTVGLKEKENTMKLLRNNFDEPRWKATALKNAYALLSKRRFEYAAAFFLLGGHLPDAVNVCVNQLKDFQLAVAIARAWDKDNKARDEVLQKLIQNTLLRKAADSPQGRWMAAWGYCHLQEWAAAIQTIVKSPVSTFDAETYAEVEGIPGSLSPIANDPVLVELYLQLRDRLVQKDEWTEDVVSPTEEWAFVMRCVRHLIRAGMSILAVRLVRNWQFVPWQTKLEVNGVENGVKRTSTDNATVMPLSADDQGEIEEKPKKPPPTQFIEPSADSLLDSFGF